MIDAPSPGNLFFLKLGGSLITDKILPSTPRLEVLGRLVEEIASARILDPSVRLLLGHGSGSFGHIPASRHGTRQGVRSSEDWGGFVEVWQQANALHRLVMDALSQGGVAALSFPPSASVVARDGKVDTWELTPISSALKDGLTPVVYGDVVFDLARGGTILSTEDLFTHLAENLKPSRLLLAGLEPGVWKDYPKCEQIVEEINPENLAELEAVLGGSNATDVTGGMSSKVRESLALVEADPNLEVCIFSGERPGNVRQALLGEEVGTIIRAIPNM